MRIACIIVGSAPTMHFANSIHRRFPVALTVVNRAEVKPNPPQPLATRLTAPLREHGLKSGLARLAMKATGRLKRTWATATPPLTADPEPILRRWFGESWRTLDADMPILEAPSSNHESVQKGLAALKPDLLLIHGGPIIKQPILATAGTALNLHWGLSPYYRGGHCTERL